MQKTEGQIAYEAWRGSAKGSCGAGECGALSSGEVPPFPEWGQLPEATKARWESRATPKEN